MLGTDRDANGRANHGAAAGEIERLAEGGKHPLRQRHGCRRLSRRRLDDGELITAHARDDVAFTHILTQSLGHGDQQLISCVVAARVVHRLEVIQIKTEQRKAAFVGARADHQPFQALVEHQTVGKLCQIVVVCDETDLVLADLSKQCRADTVRKRGYVCHHQLKVRPLTGETHDNRKALLLNPNRHANLALDGGRNGNLATGSGPRRE